MDNNLIDPKEIEAAFDEVINKLDKLHQVYAQAAGHFGFMRDSLIQAKPYWVEVTVQASQDKTLIPVSVSGGTLINTLGQEINRIENQQIIPEGLIYSAATHTDSFLAETSTLSYIMKASGINEIKYSINPFLPEKDQTTYADRFARLSPALGDTYRQIWETLYGTRADPERAALFLMRQAFDHLFDKLAPDNKVRASEYWKHKEGKNSDLVTREERIQYAAFTQVSDSIKAKNLAEESKLVVKIYNLLNQAHIRFNKKGTVVNAH